jgi:hypothetical protein
MTSVLKEYNVNFHRAVLLFLRNTPANSAYNNLKANIGVNEVSIRGFIGVVGDTSNIIHGAFCWGLNSDLKTIIFQIDPTQKGKALISFPDSPAGWSFEKNLSHLLILSNGYHFILRQRYHPLRDAFIS